jgi:hypothetical protein
MVRGQREVTMVGLLLVTALSVVDVASADLPVALELQGVDECELQALPTCPVHHAPGDEAALGDDRFDIYAVVLNAKVRTPNLPSAGPVDSPGVVLDHRGTYVENPVFFAAEWAFVRVNETLPPPVTDSVSLHNGTAQNGGTGFWVRVHPYAVVPAGPRDRTTGTGMFYGEEFITRDRIYPLTAVTEGFGNDDVYNNVSRVGTLCPPEVARNAGYACTAVAHILADAASDLEEATPSVALWVAVRHAAVTSGDAQGGLALQGGRSAYWSPDATVLGTAAHPVPAHEASNRIGPHDGSAPRTALPGGVSANPASSATEDLQSTAVGSVSGPYLWLAAAGGVLVALAVALYRRLRPQRLLDHPHRRSILALVVERPGVTIAGLAQALGLDYKSAMHHVDLLVEFGHLSVHLHGRERRLFAASARVAREQRAATVALARPSAQRILAALRDVGPVPKGALPRVAGLSRTAAWRGLRVLTGLGVVVVEGPARGAVVRLAEAQGTGSPEAQSPSAPSPAVAQDTPRARPASQA